MPNISGAGTFTSATEGFKGLLATNKERVFSFAGSSIGDSCTIQQIDDQGVARTVEGGSVTSLPRSFTIRINAPLQIVTTGAANLNVTITS